MNLSYQCSFGTFTTFVFIVVFALFIESEICTINLVCSSLVIWALPIQVTKTIINNNF